MADVGGLIAQSHARRMTCACCGDECEPTIIQRRTIGRDYFERLRCKRLGTTFQRVWIGGYQ